jgi:hypothetical protein
MKDFLEKERMEDSVSLNLFLNTKRNGSQDLPNSLGFIIESSHFPETRPQEIAIITFPFLSNLF